MMNFSSLFFTHFEICGECSGWCVSSGDEVASQLLDGGHGRPEDTTQTEKQVRH